MKLDEWVKTGRTKKLFREYFSPREEEPPSADLHDIPFFREDGASGNASVNAENGIEYSTLRRIEIATRRYLGRSTGHPDYPAVKPQIMECAQRLFDTARQRRSENHDRWEYFIGNQHQQRLSAISTTFHTRVGGAADRSDTGSAPSR